MTVLVVGSITDTVSLPPVGDVDVAGFGAGGADRHPKRSVADGDGGGDALARTSVTAVTAGAPGASRAAGRTGGATAGVAGVTRASGVAGTDDAGASGAAVTAAASGAAAADRKSVV